MKQDSFVPEWPIRRGSMKKLSLLVIAGLVLGFVSTAVAAADSNGNPVKKSESFMRHQNEFKLDPFVVVRSLKIIDVPHRKNHMELSFDIFVVMRAFMAGLFTAPSATNKVAFETIGASEPQVFALPFLLPGEHMVLSRIVKA